MANGFKPLTILEKKLNHRYLIGSKYTPESSGIAQYSFESFTADFYYDLLDGSF